MPRRTFGCFRLFSAKAYIFIRTRIIIMIHIPPGTMRTSPAVAACAPRTRHRAGIPFCAGANGRTAPSVRYELHQKTLHLEAALLRLCRRREKGFRPAHGGELCGQAYADPCAHRLCAPLGRAVPPAPLRRTRRAGILRYPLPRRHDRKKGELARHCGRVRVPRVLCGEQNNARRLRQSARKKRPA